MRRSILGVVLFASVAAVEVARGQEAPRGWAKVADSFEQFSATQGQDGWQYLFDRGPGTPVEQMQYFIVSGALRIWCSAPRPAVDTFCQIHAGWSHANSPGACSTPWAGTQRPIRSWSHSVSEKLLIHVVIEAATTTSGLLTQLRADGAVVGEWAWTFGNALPVDAWIEVPSASVISLIDDSLGDNCHGDGHQIAMRVYALDCDGNGVSDAVERVRRPEVDRDGDGILDACQPPACADADLFPNGAVNGADLGILLSQWGAAPAGTVSDLNRDGTVDGADLGVLLSFWGPCAP